MEAVQEVQEEITYGLQGNGDVHFALFATCPFCCHSFFNSISHCKYDFSNSTLCPDVQSLLSGKGKAYMQEGKYV